MHRSLLSILECPSCRKPYGLVEQQSANEEILQGFLHCACRTLVIPILDGFAFFTEPLLHAGLADPQALAALSMKLFGTAAEYAQYRREKLSRKVQEPYAAFHPFNESTRALDPLLPRIKSLLNPGDFVIDTWCRTGWSAVWLAGELAQQRVVSLWEGNSSVLGYRGFRHLLGPGQRPDHLDILFAHPERPLPFRGGSFGFLYSHDVLHRYGLYPAAGECLRVTYKDAPIVFSHVHLSNSEPEPFFERGGTQLHGRDYRAWLDGVTRDSPRRGFVLSEAKLFDAVEPLQLEDDSQTSHYNALIAILAAAHTPVPATVPADHWRYILNPLFRINLARGSARVAPASDEVVQHLLDRHPIYRRRLPTGSVALDPSQLFSLVLASGGATRASILSAAGAQAPTVSAALEYLTNVELLRPAPLDAAGHLMQRVHGNQYAHCLADSLWAALASLQEPSAALLSLPDGSTLNQADVVEFAKRLQSFLCTRGLQRGEWIGVSPGVQPLLWMTVLAAAASGSNVHVGGETRAIESQPTLWLCDDGAPSATPAIPLGLSGGRESLLQLLSAETPALTETESGNGSIEFPLGRAPVRMPVQALIAGCAALQSACEPQIWILGGKDALKDLLTVILVLLRAEALSAS